MTSYGEVGVNVGSVGRWTRFVLGIVVFILVATDLFFTTHTHSSTFYLLMVMSFLAILAIFTSVHVLIGDKLINKNSIWATLIFVVPTMFLLIAPDVNLGMQIGYWINIPALNHPFQMALILYIGISFFAQWRDKYGGCEVVSIPNLFFRKNYGSYCVPLLPLDIVEKLIVEKIAYGRPALNIPSRISPLKAHKG
jgi:hypothetical protein